MATTTQFRATGCYGGGGEGQVHVTASCRSQASRAQLRSTVSSSQSLASIDDDGAATDQLPAEPLLSRAGEALWQLPLPLAAGWHASSYWAAHGPDLPPRLDAAALALLLGIALTLAAIELPSREDIREWLASPPAGELRSERSSWRESLALLLACGAMGALVQALASSSSPILQALLSLLILSWAVAATLFITVWQLRLMEQRASAKNTLAQTMRWRRVMLSSVPMLKHLEEKDVLRIAEVLHSERVDESTDIIRKGDAADCMYIVQEIGSSEPVVEIGGKVVRKYARGHYFGELALLLDRPRSATVRVFEGTQLLRLDRADFERFNFAEFREFSEFADGNRSDDELRARLKGFGLDSSIEDGGSSPKKRKVQSARDLGYEYE